MHSTPAIPRIRTQISTHSSAVEVYMLTLSPDELEELSGYKRAHEQRAWLDAQGIPYVLDRWRRPKVLRSAVETALAGAQDEAEPPIRLDRVR